MIKPWNGGDGSGFEVGSHEADEAAELMGEAGFIVVPHHDLEHGLVHDSGEGGVHGAAMSVADVVDGNEGLIAVAESFIEPGFGGVLEGGVDFLSGDFGFEFAGEVDEGDVGGRHTQSAAVEQAVQFGDDETHSLRGARPSGCRRAGAGSWYRSGWWS